MTDQTLLKLGDSCRAFQVTDLVQNFKPADMLGNWFPLYSSKNPIIEWASSMQECPAVTIEKWDLDTIKNRPLAKRFDISKFDGFFLNYGYNMKGTTLPIKV